MKRTICVLAAGMALLSACGSEPESPKNEVPALESTGQAPPSATSGADDGDRPRERLDMTDEEQAALNTAFEACRAQHGFDRSKVSSMGREEASKAEISSARACRAKDPLPPWELDVNNPKGADFLHAVVLCLREHGVTQVEESQAGGRYSVSLGGSGNDPSSISKGLQFTDTCEKKTAAQGIGR